MNILFLVSFHVSLIEKHVREKGNFGTRYRIRWLKNFEFLLINSSPVQYSVGDGHLHFGVHVNLHPSPSPPTELDSNSPLFWGHLLGVTFLASNCRTNLVRTP